MEKVCIIGLGKLGSHLYYSLNKTRKYNVTCVIKSSKTKIDPLKFNMCGIIFICTDDSAVSKIVKQLTGKKFNLKNKYIYHTSGALDSGILKPLEARGAFTGSFHPVQTFKSRLTGHNQKLSGIYIAVEGSAKASVKAAEIAKALKSKTVLLSKNDKVLHHISSVFASNYLVAYMSLLEKVSHELSATYRMKKILKNGFKKTSFLNIYKPLIEQTLKNVETYGTVKSLTGPIERNDLVTVKLHLNTLRNRIPELLPFYSALGIEAAEIALKKKSISRKDANVMINMLKKYSSKQKKKKN